MARHQAGSMVTSEQQQSMSTDRVAKKLNVFRGQVALDEIYYGGWTDTSCRGSVGIETAGELWWMARETE